MKLEISERALRQRIDRKLAAENKKLLVRDGKYFVLDRKTNEVDSKSVSLTVVGRMLGVMAEWEKLK